MATPKNPRAAKKAAPTTPKARKPKTSSAPGESANALAWLMDKLPAHLSDGGVLLLEVGHERAHFEAAFPRLQPVWLPSSAGDDAVLLLTREDLIR